MALQDHLCPPLKTENLKIMSALNELVPGQESKNVMASAHTKVQKERCLSVVQ